MSEKKSHTKRDGARGMKSAYELALERMESRGVERPSELPDETKAKIADARKKAEARLAELEIRHHERMGMLGSAAEREQEKDEYRIDRRRIEEELERKIAEIRESG